MLCFVFLILSTLQTVSSIVTLNVNSTAEVSVPTEVHWTRERGDPTQFVLRFSEKQADAESATEVNANRDQFNGNTTIVFTEQGPFTVKAIDIQNGQQLAISSPINVVVPPLSPEPTSSTTSTVQPPTTITSSTGQATTSPPTPEPTKLPSHVPSPTGSSLHNTNRLPAIVGGVVGGIVGLGLLIAVFILLRRRNSKALRRLTFRRSMMVQSRRAPTDVEHGQHMSQAPLPSSFPVTMPSPVVPTRPTFSPSAIAMPVPKVYSTDRQVQLDDRIEELEQRMIRIRRQNRGQAAVEPMLEQTRHQVEWLKFQRNSPWARHETDVPPPELDLYWD